MIFIYFAITILIANCNGMVLSTNDQDIKGDIDSNEYTLVNFYSPTCNICARFESEYEKASMNHVIRELRVKFLKIDATTEVKTAEELKIKGYHHVLLFKHGQYLGEYEGIKEYNHLINWIESKILQNL